MKHESAVNQEKLKQYWKHGLNRITGFPDVKVKGSLSYDATLKVVGNNAKNVFKTTHG